LFKRDFDLCTITTHHPLYFNCDTGNEKGRYFYLILIVVFVFV
jgi:hypothetical protein